LKSITGLLLINLVLLTLALGGCRATNTPPTADALSVVATTNIVGDVVSRVGGDRIKLTTLMKVGVDPHSYAPTPADTAAIHDAQAVFANGAGLEENMAKMLARAGGNAMRISLADGLDLREMANGESDPHLWFDVQNVIQWVRTIERTLSDLDPDGAQTYAANAGAYIRELETLDTWIAEQISSIPPRNRKLVTSHPAFGYLADRYGLEQVGAVYPINPSSEPSAQDIARLQDVINDYGLPAVFAESTINPKVSEQIAQDTDVKLVPLYTGSLGGPGSGAETYIEMMRYDVRAIAEALK